MTQTITLPDGTEVDVNIGITLAVNAVRPAPPPPPPPPPPAFTPVLLDFGNTPVQSGYTGFPWAAYSASPGYGYTSASPDFPNLDRGAAIYVANPDLYRDGHANTYANGNQSFKFGNLTPGTSYDVRGLFYDASGACNGVYFFRDKNTPANTVAPVVTSPSGATPGVGVLTIAANGSGEIEVEWNNTTGPGSFAYCNGLGIALAGELPAALG